MAEQKGEETLEQQQNSQNLSKRKPDIESAGDEAAAVDRKKQKREISSDPLPHKETGVEEQDNTKEEENLKEDGVNSNGNATVDKGKGVVTAVDKGKGKMVVEDDEEEAEDDDDTDDDDDDESDDVTVGGEDYDSDFSDDPLAEVELSNIIPSRTRRQMPPQPGAYLVNDQDADDDDDDEDDDDDDCD